MVRRTPKPFTVEIRSSRRKPGAAAAIEQDQPHVEWPSAMFEALREEPAPVPPVIAEEPQARRILRALDEAVTPSFPDDEAADIDDDVPQADFDMEPDSEPEVPDPVEQPVVTETAPVTPKPREGRARRSRDEFARGERWKARLPAAVHRTRRSPRKP